VISDVAASAAPGSEVTLDRVGKTYGEGASAVEALRSVSVGVDRGELVVVLGPSGSGKTTLLNLIGALERPSSGSVLVAGRQLEALDEAARTMFRREKVGFVFQFFNLVPSLTALENVALVLELTGSDDVERRALEALGAVDLGDRLDHFPAQLSGGEQQRVAIARAIVKRPDVLLCDEPTGALDVQTGKLVLEAIDRINRELGTTAVVITHNAAIAGMADRVIVLGDGRIQREERIAHKVSPAELVW
jgi:putative ABC transport system ATP-binding protein